MSGKARTEISNARLISHISTSISRIEWASTFFHFSYTCVIQLVEVIVILLCTIGVSSLPGVAIVIAASASLPLRLDRLADGSHCPSSACAQFRSSRGQ